jgi:hypothetical protein
MALLTYDSSDRTRVKTGGNSWSSRTPRGNHLPLIDLDFPHQYLPSSTPGHGHLYLDREISWFRWVVLMIGLYSGGVVEKGYFWWSLRRGQNYLRKPGVLKETQ